LTSHSSCDQPRAMRFKSLSKTREALLSKLAYELDPVVCGEGTADEGVGGRAVSSDVEATAVPSDTPAEICVVR